MYSPDAKQLTMYLWMNLSPSWIKCSPDAKQLTMYLSLNLSLSWIMYSFDDKQPTINHLISNMLSDKPEVFVFIRIIFDEIYQS